MLFWVIAAVLTLGASLAVLLPLTSRPKAETSSEDHDLEVYRDQLSELDRDVSRGLIQPSEAEQARAEVARRIIRLAGGEKAEARSRVGPGSLRLISAAAVLAVPLVSWGLYAAIGSPDLPSQPLQERLSKNPADSSVDELVARAEAHLATNPSDGKGWDVLAPIYMRMGRFSDAVTAYRNAIRLDGSSAARQAGLGEALANTEGGIISADAQAAFEEALKIDASNPKAGFYLAMGMAQEGRKDEAVAAWRKMLDGLPQGSPWRAAAEQALAESESQVAAASGSKGPSKEEVDAASSMSSQDRTAMIETMVAGLDQKLRQNARDEEGWMKLIRSYVVLGKPDEAKDALDRGIAAFGPDSEQARKFSAFAASLGLAKSE